MEHQQIKQIKLDLLPSEWEWDAPPLWEVLLGPQFEIHSRSLEEP